MPPLVGPVEVCEEVVATGFVHGCVFVLFCPGLQVGGFLLGFAVVLFWPVLQ